MRRLLLLALLAASLCASAQSPGQVTAQPGNLAGALYASSFGQWQVPQGTNGSFSWPSAAICNANANGFYLSPVFQVGTPILIVDQNPAHNEIVTPTQVIVNGSGCSIVVHPTFQHLNFYLTSGTAGLQEAINFAKGLPYVVHITPDWTRLHGTTAMITSALGNANVSILDERTSCTVSYIWNGSSYATNGGACGNGGPVLEHNSSLLPVQDLLNFVDTPPTLDPGFQAVKFVNNGAGQLGAETMQSSGLTVGIDPPISGQFVPIFPTACSTSISQGATATCDDNSAKIQLTGPCLGTSCFAQANWTGFTLPSYVNPANVTAVYAQMGYTSQAGTITGIGCSSGVGGCSFPDGPTSGDVQKAQLICSGPCDLSTLTFAAGFGGSGSNGTLSVFQVALLVYYTGSAPPASNEVQVFPPLIFDTGSNSLSLSPNFPAGTIGVTIANLPTTHFNPSQLYTVSDGQNATDCTTGGGSITHQCLWNGSAWTAYGGGSSISLTTTGTSGAASLTGTMLNVPQYQGQLTLTTTGTSGPATLSGNTLNIPQYSGGSGSGVSSLNTLTGALSLTSSDSSVSITPSGSSIDLKTTGGGGGGVQYNPPTTNYIFVSYSGLWDDNHNLSSPVPISTYTCNGVTCTVVTSSPHNMNVGGYVEMDAATGFPGTGADDRWFQIIGTGFSTTQFEFNFSASSPTCSSSCGSAYDANYYAISRIANEPYIKGHGTVYGIFSTAANLATTMSTKVAPLCASGSPSYVIFEVGQNDLNSGVSNSTIEGEYQSAWAAAHTAGCQVVQGTLVAFDSGLADQSVFVSESSLNRWLMVQAKSFSGASSGQYWDYPIDFNSYMYDRGVGTLEDSSVAGQIFADRVNDAFSTQQPSSAIGASPMFNQGDSNNGVLHNLGGAREYWVNGNGNVWIVLGCCGNGGAFDRIINPNPGFGPQLQLDNSGTGTFCQLDLGEVNSGGTPEDRPGTGDALTVCFNYVSDGSASNFASLGLKGATSPGIELFSDHVTFPQLAGGGTQTLAVDNTGKLMATAAGGTVTFNGYGFSAPTSLSTTSLTSTSIGVSAGDLLVGVCRFGSGTTYSVVSSPSETWTLAQSQTNSSNTLNMYYAVAGTSGTHTLTCTQGAASQFESVILMGYTGPTALNVASGNSNGFNSGWPYQNTQNSPNISSTARSLVLNCGTAFSGTGMFLGGAINGQAATLRAIDGGATVGTQGTDSINNSTGCADLISAKAEALWGALSYSNNASGINILASFTY